MSLEQFINLLAAIFGAIGSIYVLKSYLEQTPETTERLVSSRMGHNLDLLDSLSAQKAEGITGSSLIIITLIIATLNMIASPSKVIINNNKLYPILLAVIISLIVYFLLALITKVIYNRHLNIVARGIAIKTLKRVLEQKNIPLYETKSLRFLSDRYFKIGKTSDMTSKEFLHILVKHIGLSIPDDTKIEEQSK